MPLGSVFTAIYEMIRDATGDEDMAKRAADAAYREVMGGGAKIDTSPLESAIRDAEGIPRE